MNLKMNYIQASEGGSVTWEKWTPEEAVSTAYVTQNVLKERIIALPDGWKTGKNIVGQILIFDSNNDAVEIRGGYNSAIYALSSESNKKVYLTAVHNG